MIIQNVAIIQRPGSNVLWSAHVRADSVLWNLKFCSQ